MGAVDPHALRAERIESLVSQEHPKWASMQQKLVGYLDLKKGAMPQDVKVSPDGKVFYIADMMSDGIWMVDRGHALEMKRPVPVRPHVVHRSRARKRVRDCP